MQLLKMTMILLLVGFFAAHPEPASAVADLPVIITPAKLDHSDKLVVFISGDGGWNTFSQQVADTYAALGMPVVGLNSAKYFWKKKSPQQAANDLAGLMNRYLNEFQKKKIVFCGYSFGADVVPFIYRRLPEHLKEKVSLLQLLSPASFTDFEIHISDLLGTGDHVRTMNIGSELKMIDTPVLCYYGSLEKEKPQAKQQNSRFKVIIVPGDHHYKDSLPDIAKSAAGK